MSVDKQEFELVKEFHEIRSQRKELEAQLEIVNEKAKAVEERILEVFSAQDKKGSAKYEGLGWVTIGKPQIRASLTEEVRNDAFKYLRSIKRGDLIKETVNAKSLSTFVGSMLEEGKEIPGCIPYTLVTNALAYDENGKRI